MGAHDSVGAQPVTEKGGPPGNEEFEFTLLGPGYGESIVMHVGGGAWIVVDSCADPDGRPFALPYLESVGVDPARAIAVVAATHWHDDHIRGLARILELCPDAQFCCASALCREEFLAMVGTLEGRHFSTAGSGVRELYEVFSLLHDKKKRPLHALANRVIFKRDRCQIWSLSPSDDVFQTFLRSVGDLIPREGGNKTRISSLSPNKAAVVLWVEGGQFSLLLGADMERQGWVAILGDAARPTGQASVFKIPHHGSENANEPAVWERMLEERPVAVLTPWRRGGRALPTKPDAERILRATPNAWITDKGLSGRDNFRHENRTVEKTLRESGARIRRLAGDRGLVRLRRLIDSDDRWAVETFGGACCLVDYAA